MIGRRRLGWIGSALGVVIAIGASLSWAGDDAAPPKAGVSQTALAERFRDAKAEWEVLEQPFYLTLLKATTKADKENALAAKPDVIPLALRMVNLAESSPDDPAVAGAMLWLLNRSGWPLEGPMAEIERRAIGILVEHHANDLAVDRAGINLAGKFSPNCAAFLEAVVEKASKPEARGMASLGLAFYLIKKADTFERFQAADTGETGPTATAKAFRENWRVRRGRHAARSRGAADGDRESLPGHSVCARRWSDRRTPQNAGRSRRVVAGRDAQSRHRQAGAEH